MSISLAQRKLYHLRPLIKNNAEIIEKNYAFRTILPQVIYMEGKEEIFLEYSLLFYVLWFLVVALLRRLFHVPFFQMLFPIIGLAVEMALVQLVSSLGVCITIKCFLVSVAIKLFLKQAYSTKRDFMVLIINLRYLYISVIGAECLFPQTMSGSLTYLMSARPNIKKRWQQFLLASLPQRISKGQPVSKVNTHKGPRTRKTRGRFAIPEDDSD